MKTQRTIISFDKLTDALFNAKSAHIVNSMTDNDYFPTPVPAMGIVQDGMSDYSSAFAAAADLGKNNIARKNATRQSLEALLKQLGLYVTSVSNGNVQMLTSSGYDITKLPQPRYITNPGVVELFNGPASGQLVAMIKSVPGARSYTFEITDALPSDTTNWTSIVVSTCKYTFTELQPGKQYWVRVAAAGSRKQLLYSLVYSQYAQ